MLSICERLQLRLDLSMYVLYICVLDESELSFVKSLAAFAHQMSALNLNETELALLCALVLINPSK